MTWIRIGMSPLRFRVSQQSEVGLECEGNVSDIDWGQLGQGTDLSLGQPPWVKRSEVGLGSEGNVWD